MAQVDHLSRLPTELLDEICALVVVTRERIEISLNDMNDRRSAPKIPPFCQTNRRLRRLSLPLYYGKNCFEHWYDHFDRSLGIEFTTFAEKQGLRVSDIKDVPTTRVYYVGPEAKANMLIWAKLHYEESPKQDYAIRLPIFNVYEDEGENTQQFFKVVHKI